VTLLAFAAKRGAVAAERWRLLHRSCRALSAGALCSNRSTSPAQQQTHRPLLLLSIDGTDRRTDGRPPRRFIDSPRILCGHRIFCFNFLCTYRDVSERVSFNKKYTTEHRAKLCLGHRLCAPTCQAFPDCRADVVTITSHFTISGKLL